MKNLKQKNLRALSASLVMLLALQPSVLNAQAKNTVTCETVIEAADEAIADLEAVNKLQAELIDNMRSRVEAAERKQDSIIRHPALWFAIGAAGMGLVIGFVRR